MKSLHIITPLTATLASVLLMVALADAAAAERMRDMEQQFVAWSNLERQKAGVPAVKSNLALQEAAASFVLALAQDEVPCPTGHVVRGREDSAYVDAHGYQSWGVATCVHGIPKGYNGYNTPANYMFYAPAPYGWMNSPGHKANILNPSMKEMGAGVYRSDKGTYYALLIFASPQSDKLHFSGTITNSSGFPVSFQYVTKAGAGKMTVIQPGKSVDYNEQAPTVENAFLFHSGNGGTYSLPVRNGHAYVAITTVHPQTKQPMLLVTAQWK